MAGIHLARTFDLDYIPNTRWPSLSLLFSSLQALLSPLPHRTRDRRKHKPRSARRSSIKHAPRADKVCVTLLAQRRRSTTAFHN